MVDLCLTGLAFQAKAAWAMPLGRHELEGWFDLKPAPVIATRHQKLVVISQSEGMGYYRIVAYPDPEHFELFADKVARFRMIHSVGSHQDTNPSGIGTVLLWEDDPEKVYRRPKSSIKGKTYFIMQYAQAHFRVGQAHWQVPRSIATHYGGWRVHCLEEAIQLGREKPALISIPRLRLWSQERILPPLDSPERNQLLLDIEKAASNKDAQIVPHEDEITIIP